MDFVKMESFPAGENPFNHNLFHMGTRIAKDVIIMHPNHPGEETKYFIIMHVKTGEQVKVVL